MDRRGVTRVGALAVAVVWGLAVRTSAAEPVADPAAPQAEAAAEETASAPAVTVDGDRVTGTFTQTAPDEIVRAIAEAAGAEVVGAPEATDPTSLRLADTPIDRALERALGGQSFTIVYGGDGRVRRIRLHGGPQEGAPGGAVVGGKAPTAAGGRLLPHQLFDVSVRIPSVGPLAEHIGGETATLGQLYRIAVDQDEAALRIAAVDAAMAAIESDANLQASIDSLLDATDDTALAGLLRTSAGKRANELISRILSRTRRPQVRQRAVNVLRELRNTGG